MTLSGSIAAFLVHGVTLKTSPKLVRSDAAGQRRVQKTRARFSALRRGSNGCRARGSLRPFRPRRAGQEFRMGRVLRRGPGPWLAGIITRDSDKLPVRRGFKIGGGFRSAFQQANEIRKYVQAIRLVQQQGCDSFSEALEQMGIG